MTKSKVFVVGGTGAQGIPVVRGLVQDGAHSVRALTRDTKSSRSKQLVSLGDVELHEGTWADEATLHSGFRVCQYAFVNIDGFNSGEKTEMIWAIRAYEIAMEEGIKFYVYGNLDYAYKLSGYQPALRCGHYEYVSGRMSLRVLSWFPHSGKGRVGEWILYQNKDNSGRMGAALFTTGPYMEMALGKGTPMSPRIEDGVVTWSVPLGDGAVPHTALDDCAHYVRWLFDHQGEGNGMDLQVAIDHLTYEEVAEAFTKVTGKPTRAVRVSMEDYWRNSPFVFPATTAAGYNAASDGPANMTGQSNFTGWWNA